MINKGGKVLVTKLFCCYIKYDMKWNQLVTHRSVRRDKPLKRPVWMYCKGLLLRFLSQRRKIPVISNGHFTDNSVGNFGKIIQLSYIELNCSHECDNNLTREATKSVDCFVSYFRFSSITHKVCKDFSVAKTPSGRLEMLLSDKILKENLIIILKQNGAYFSNC